MNDLGEMLLVMFLSVVCSVILLLFIVKCFREGRLEDSFFFCFDINK